MTEPADQPDTGGEQDDDEYICGPCQNRKCSSCRDVRCECCSAQP